MSLGSFFRKHKRCCFGKRINIAAEEVTDHGEFKFAIPRLSTAKEKKYI